jgi:hypothetical protein
MEVWGEVSLHEMEWGEATPPPPLPPPLPPPHRLVSSPTGSRITSLPIPVAALFFLGQYQVRTVRFEVIQAEKKSEPFFY